ncbi:PKD domain-containing protein [Haloarcula regularis]|uniref:PKD domain-containing protein n=1 Tax=Haloarcula regularis TaxID=3033392 RepID=UPI0023E78F8E|nr:PKD domain-containing protein [Halomicroarcula sp. SYNS111]
MPRSLTACAVLILCVSGLSVSVAATTSNAPPLADAGLDQTVGPDATVHLDANGSRDPDGAIASVAWTIEAPDGTTTRPDCPTCRQTEFQPATTGRYEVTLNVTDDDGATRSDTLFVDVQAGTDPAVTLSGPTTVVRNRSATLTADVDAGDATLSSLAWVLDGSVVQRDTLAGDSATVSLERTYTATDSVPVRTVVYDSAGRRNSTTREVTVYIRGSDGGDGNSEDCHFWSNNCLNDAVLTNSETGTETVINANGEAGIQVLTDAYGQVDAREYVDVSKYRTSGGENGPVLYEAEMIDTVNKATLDKTEKQNENSNQDRDSADENNSSSNADDDGEGGSDGGYTDSGAEDGYNTGGAGNAGSPSTGNSSDSSHSWSGSAGTSFGGFSGGSYF